VTAKCVLDTQYVLSNSEDVEVVKDAEAHADIPTSDSTDGPVYGIDSERMATMRNGGHSEASTGVMRAALYARVSDPNQAKEGTIESQVFALKE
jgi:hypothetical protein